MNAADAANATTRPIPKGIVQRAVEGVRYAISGVAPNNWFGPMQPLPPMAPPEVAGRRFDYPTGYNLQYTPRSYEPVGFADLRALADNCDILRLVIETRKDQIEAQDWDIRPMNQADGTRPRAGAFAADIAAAKGFLAFPDREHDFSQWTRQIAEEMFVIDAASLYKRRDRKGRVSALEIIDGTTIAPRIDQWGRTPAPPDVAYQQILHGVPAADYARDGLAAMTTDELIYYPRNKRPGHVYGQSPVEQIILTANIVMRRSLHQLAYYTDGNLTDAVFTAPSGWTSDQIKVWQTYWNALFAGNLRERRHGTWVPEGTKYVPLKDVVLKDAFDEYLARIVCFCFSISPQPFVAQVNRATAETAKAQATEEGLAPVLNWFKRLFDLILQRHLGYGALEFVWIDDREMDPSAADAIDVADVKAGIRTINEVRMSRGLDALPGGDKLLVATGAGYVPVVASKSSQQAPSARTSQQAPAQIPARTPTRHRARKLTQAGLAKFNPNHWPAGAPDSQGGQFAPKGEGGGAGGTATNGEADVATSSSSPIFTSSGATARSESDRQTLSSPSDETAGKSDLVLASLSSESATNDGATSGETAAQAPRPEASDIDSFGHQVAPDEPTQLDQLDRGPAIRSSGPSDVIVSSVESAEEPALSGAAPAPPRQVSSQELSAIADSNPTENVRVTAGEAPDKDSFGNAVGPDGLEPSAKPVGSHGYMPAPGDEELLARSIFAEGSNTPDDMPALAWAIVNRIGLSKYPGNLSDVIHQPGQFQFAPEGNRSGQPSKKWKQFDDPGALKPADLASRQHAIAVAQGVLGGWIHDPTGGATHFFARPSYNGTPETAPPGWWRGALHNNQFSPSPYAGSQGNHFFILKPESEWLSNRHRSRP